MSRGVSAACFWLKHTALSCLPSPALTDELIRIQFIKFSDNTSVHLLCSKLTQKLSGRFTEQSAQSGSHLYEVINDGWAPPFRPCSFSMPARAMILHHERGWSHPATSGAENLIRIGSKRRWERVCAPSWPNSALSDRQVYEKRV